jgi:hypothetical protein
LIGSSSSTKVASKGKFLTLLQMLNCSGVTFLKLGFLLQEKKGLN